ncbi:hypothetical protein HNO92_002964 [Chromobacterium alkanivorans]|uniref:condensation domain-containing protein n=1 Tax=Chromobacterium alkanivorans TaxID=1071719 RepID=UPI002167CF42|nr:condensation domain-containing protein [Chromobacterium alkanivorans]MCS3803728.1 hypothetical protein [Chromobacterium alkanivorans]MCS3818167.1 hypothetical protein [Chromobacterium alkanivorans]MCS3874634.1 hypothetical protein [Chromobacterium alkanivorans]
MKFSLDAGYGWLASFQQQGLFRLDQLTPDTPSCPFPIALQISGALDVAALETALAAVVAKHESLRSTLAFDGDELRCWTRHAWPGPLLQLRRLEPDSGNKAELDEAARDIIRRPFDLATGPLFRFVLLQQAETEARLLMVFHQAVFDAWSAGILAADLETAYAAALSGGDVELAPNALDYADFAHWQREPSRAGAPQRPPSNADKIRTDGAELALKLPSELEQALRRLQQETGETLLAVFSSLLGLFLGAQSGRDEVLIDAFVPGRSHAEDHEIIGLFEHQLPLRLRLDAKPSLLEVLDQVREQALPGFDTQNTSFEKLVAAPTPPSLARPQFQAAARVRQGPRWRLAGLRLAEQAAHAGTSKRDLSFVLDERDDGLWLTLEYASAVFEAAAAQRLLHGLVQFAAPCLAEPSRRLDEWPAADQLDLTLNGSWRDDDEAAEPGLSQADAGLGQLSSNQQSLYFFEKLAPDRALYNVPLHLEMRGQLDPASLEAALEQLLSRHQALSTRFVETPSGLRQEIGAPPSRLLETADLSQLPQESRDAGFASLERTFSSTVFDLAAGRLCRFCLVRRDREHWALLMVFHHMVFDGHSAQLWLRDLRALLRDGALPSAGPATTVREAAAEERAWQRSRDYQTELNRWLDRLTGTATPLNLRPDRPRPMRRDYAGAFLECTLPQALLGEHIQRAAQLGASPFMAVAALLAGYLSARGHQADVCMGFPHGGRGDGAIEETIGNFVNLLALPLRIEAADTPRKLIEKTRQTAQASYAGYRVPFSSLVERLGVERIPGQHPIFQVVVTVDQDFKGWTERGLAVTLLPGTNPIAKFDLAFGFNLARSCVRIEYATDMFDPASIADMGAELAALLSQCVRGFDAPLRQAAGAPVAAEVPRAAPKLLRKPKPASTGDAGGAADAT